MKNFLSKNKDTLITLGIVTVAYIIIEILVKKGAISSLFKGLLVPLCAYIILAISLNLTVGILGELSLGHAGFMCIGAFTSAFFSKLTVGVITPNWFRFVLAILVGFIFAGIFGFLIGMPVLRLKGDYLAIVTLAFGEIIKNIMNVLYVGRDGNGIHISMRDSVSLNLADDGEVLINGAQGITGTPKDSTFTAGFILIVISLIIILNFIKSREGRAVMAIRDNVIAAESVGINVTRYKLLAFSLSAALAGVAGVLYSHNLNSLMATTKNFGYNMSIMILVFVVLGGIGSIRGSVISAVILTLLPELLRGLSTYRMLIYAIVLIAMMLFNWAPSARAFRARLLEKLPFGKKKALDEEV